MPSFIYRGLAKGASTLVNLEESCNHGTVGVPTGGGGSHTIPLDAKEYTKVAKDLKLSGALADKIGKLKVDDQKAKKQKLRDLSPIKFDIHQKPKN